MKNLDKIKKHLQDMLLEVITDTSSDTSNDKTSKIAVDSPSKDKDTPVNINESELPDIADILNEDEEDNTPTHKDGALNFIKQVGKRNQFKVAVLHTSDDNSFCGFRYQGGYFIARAGVKEPYIFLQFGRFAEMPYNADNYQRALQICHRCNSALGYGKFTFNYDEESNSLLFSIAVETIEPSEHAFISYMGMMMRMANEVREYISGHKQGHLPYNGSIPDDDEDLINIRRDLYRLAKAEMKQQDKAIREHNPKARKPKSDTVGEYLSYLFDGEQPADLLSLTVQSSQGVQELTDHKQIYDFNLLSCAVRGKGKKASFVSDNPIVLTLDAATNHYIFTLHPVGAEKEFLSMRLTAVRTPHEFMQDYTPAPVYVPKAYSLKLCFIKTTKKAVQPTETREPFIPGLTSDYADQFRKAHELVQNEFYYQAIVMLQPIYEAIKMRYWDMRGRDRDFFFAVCYDLGFCYTSLRLYEKAYFYLDITRNSNRYDCEQMYFNSLAEGRDVRIFEDLQGEIDETRRSIQNARAEISDSESDDIDNDSDDFFVESNANGGLNRLVDYYAFLQRRLGYSQINFGYLDAAEETFRNLLKHEGSRDYAKQELKHIALLRTNEQHRKLH
ncbi:MAG: hypothetical protein K5660_09830 [Paludibacteraceae bacterium]|nr:hypothetical protein [Paludibacteraceae bacterium]